MRYAAIPRPSTTEIERFYSHIDRKSIVRCWLWQLGVDKDGYGKTSVRGKTIRTHRLAYLLFYGVDPLELLVCHTCDNPTCCNPYHLFLGTEQINTLDAKAKGRLNTAAGERHGTRTRPDRVAKGEGKPLSAKLTAEQVIEIRHLYSRGDKTQQQIADLFHVSREAISRIILGKNWKHIATQDQTSNLSDPSRKIKAGVTNGNAKLTEDAVRYIRQVYVSGNHTCASLAQQFGVSPGLIRHVVKHRIWKHVV